jgi:signal peptidase I
MTGRRAPLLALAAGLVLPGLGQIYCGEVVRGVSVLLTMAILPPVTAWLALTAPARTLWLVVLAGALAGLGLYAWAVIDAWRLARRAPDRKSVWQRPHVYLLCTVAAYWLVFGPLVGFAREHLLETFYAPTASMLPNLSPGDRFLVDKRVNRPGGLALWRGAVAIFIHPNQRTTVYVKRIIGLPGDRVELDGASLRVNGRELRGAEVHDLGNPAQNRLLADHVAYRESGERGSYTVLWKKEEQTTKATFTVPGGQVFLLGDNRDASHDSRQFGAVPLSDVKAVARQVVFSYHAGEGLDWSRCGKLIE